MIAIHTFAIYDILDILDIFDTSDIFDVFDEIGSLDIFYIEKVRVVGPPKNEILYSLFCKFHIL